MIQQTISIYRFTYKKDIISNGHLDIWMGSLPHTFEMAVPIAMSAQTLLQQSGNVINVGDRGYAGRLQWNL